MATRIHTITTPLPFRMGQVNCYLVESGRSFILIDTGSANQRAQVTRALSDAGCRPGNLQLILLTHGDFDHIGSAGILRQDYEAPIAMHPDDAGMAVHGDMFFNRQQPNFLVRKAIGALARLPPSDRFMPDIDLQDGAHLDEFGLQAEVISLPGHSRGSIGALLADGTLFCGDLFENLKGPALNSLMDDIAAGRSSTRKLQGMNVGNVYPGHGDPFVFKELQL